MAVGSGTCTPCSVRGEEEVGLVAVEDGCDVQPDMCDGGGDGVEGDEGGDVPDDVAGDGELAILPERKSL